MEEFPSNSIDPKPEKNEKPAVVGGEKKIVKKVVHVTAVQRKKGLGSRLRQMLGGNDGQSIPDYIMYEVLGPALKDMITDAVIQGVERMVYGEARHSTRRSAASRGPVGSSSHISYNRYSTTPRGEAPRSTMSARGRGSHDFGEIELHTRAEAEEVIAQMDEIVDRFRSCSVSDLYEMVGLEAAYTDEKWGWTDMRGADVQRTRSGTYILILPRTEPIG
jgi:hypothetical protein